MRTITSCNALTLLAALVVTSCDEPMQPVSEEIDHGAHLGETASPAATFRFFSDRATFDATFPGLPLEDFEEGTVASGASVRCSNRLDENTNDACFSPGDIEPGIQVTLDHHAQGMELRGPGFFGAPSKDVLPSVSTFVLIINFTAGDVNAVGMDLLLHRPLPGQPQECTLDIHGQSGLLTSTTAPCTPGGTFWGVASSQVITQIVITGTPSSQFEAVDNIAFGPGVVPVEIDIKPGSDPNSINPKSKGVIPVAILGTVDFEVADVDVSTVVFGPDGATAAHNGHIEDGNLVLHFRTQETGIAPGDEEACLLGQTFSGVLFTGCDNVKTVGK